MTVVHYLNQFFAGLGGETAARTPPVRLDGAVGPGRAFGIPIAATFACGDDYFAEHEDEAIGALLRMLREEGATVLVAGPAFGSGRYGYACGRFAAAAGIPAVTGLHPDSPGVAAAAGHAYVVPAPVSVAGMREVAPVMGRLAAVLAAGEEPGAPETAGYLPRGYRRNFVADRIGAIRAVDYALARVRGETPTEVSGPFAPVPPPPPIPAAAGVRLALGTEGGLVPRGNPDHMPTIRAVRWHEYDLPAAVDAGTHECVHGGFDVGDVNADPNRLLPVDAIRALQAGGRVGYVLDRFFTTTGNGTPVATSEQMGAEIAARLREADIGAVILTAT